MAILELKEHSPKSEKNCEILMPLKFPIALRAPETKRQ